MNDYRDDKHSEHKRHNDIGWCSGGSKVYEGKKADDDGSDADPCKSTFHSGLLYQNISVCSRV